ncbi:hypothetical protein D5086_018450 [Populus alba]|uniref:Uncharacterized protein n=1 Tax=Populus alba TaxID=43335 RepID=A0ACC4BQE5_POPAL
MRQEALTKIYERDAIYDLVAMESDAEIESENDEETTSSEQNQTLDQTVRLRIDTTNVLKLVSRSFEDRIGDKVMVFDLYPKGAKFLTWTFDKDCLGMMVLLSLGPSCGGFGLTICFGQFITSLQHD